MHWSLLHGTLWGSLCEISSRSLICCMTTLHKSLLCFGYLQYLTTTQRASPYAGLLHKNIFLCAFLKIIFLSQPEPELIQTHSTRPSTQRVFQARGKDRAEYAQCELYCPCFVPVGLQHQPHGRDKCTGMSPCTQLCSTEAIPYLCSQKGAGRASCFQTLHEQGSSPCPLIYCSPEVWVTWSPGLLGVTTPATSATTQHRVLGKGAHPGCFPCNYMPGRGEKGGKSQ